MDRRKVFLIIQALLCALAAVLLAAAALRLYLSGAAAQAAGGYIFTREKAGAALAVSYRRTGEREQAVRVWREMIREGKGGIMPFVELAKYEEHVRRNYPAALKLTEQAMMRLSEPSLREDGTVQERQNELQYRRQRLLRKLKER